MLYGDRLEATVAAMSRNVGMFAQPHSRSGCTARASPCPRSVDELLDSPCTRTLIAHWGRLEIPYAVALSQQQTSLGTRDEQNIKDAVADLFTEFRRYEIPRKPDDKPREYDVVRL